MNSYDYIILAIGVFVFVMFRRGTKAAAAANAAATGPGTLEADRAVLRALKDAGSDLTKPTHVLFYLYFEDRETAEKACRRAETPQLKASAQLSATGTQWSVVLEGDMVPTEAAIHAESERLGAIAASLDGEYDGWEAAVA